MDSIEIKNIIDEINKLNGDEKQAAMDAFIKILSSKGGGGGGGIPLPPAPTTEIDPELEDPEKEDTDDEDKKPNPDDTEIDDPDHLLKRKKSDDDSDGEADEDDSDDSSDDELEGGKSTDGEEKDPSKKSTTKDPAEQKAEANDLSEQNLDKISELKDRIDDIIESGAIEDKDIEALERWKKVLDDLETRTIESKDNIDTQKAIEKKLAGIESRISSIEQDIDSLEDTDGDILETPDQEKAKKEARYRQNAEVSRVGKLIDKARDTDLSPEDETKLDNIEKQLEDIKQKIEKSVDELMDIDEFDAKIDDILAKLDELLDIQYDVDGKERIDTIKKISEDPFTSIELEIEDQQNIEADPTYKKMKAREAEKKRFDDILRKIKGRGADGHFPGIAQFKRDIEKALKDQADQWWQDVEEETYAKEDRRHEDDDLMTPGIHIDEIPDIIDDPPTVDFYLDQSGSWGVDEIKMALATIANLYVLEKEGKLKINIWYFSEILSQDRAAARARGGRECWDLIIKNIVADPISKNVAIMTDHDIGYDYRSAGQHGCINGPGAVVPGCVWFIWKNSSNVPEAPAKLRGERGTFQYEFNWDDVTAASDFDLDNFD